MRMGKKGEVGGVMIRYGWRDGMFEREMVEMWKIMDGYENVKLEMKKVREK